MALDKLTKLTSQSGITTTIDYQMSDLTVDTITVQSGGIKMPVGMSTFQNVTVTGDLTVNGTTTTLDTDLIGVDKLEVSGTNTTAVGIITQAGSGDILRLYDNTTQVFTVQDGGKLLLGTTTPGAAQCDTFTLETSGHTGVTLFSGTSNRGTIAFGDGRSGNAQYRGVIMYDHSDDNMNFVTSDAEKLRITSAGKVGIGITNPAEKFQVNGGNIAITGGTAYKIDTHPLVSYAGFTDISGGSYAARLGSTGSSTIRSTQIYGGGSHIATFDGVNYRLGIKETTPEASLHITGGLPHIRLENSGTSASAGDIFGQIDFKHNDSDDAGVTAAIKCTAEDAAGNSYLTFHNGDGGNADERLRITSTGQVKIGNNPTIDANTNLHIEEASGECGVVIEGNTGGAGAYLLLKNNSTSSSPRTYIGGVDAGGQGTSQIEFHNLNDGNNEGQLVLSTRPAGGSMTPTVYITSDGHLLLGGTADVTDLTGSAGQRGLVIGSTGMGNAGLAIINSTTGTGRIYFGDDTGSSANRHRGFINYYHNDGSNSDYMTVGTAGVEKLKITSDGKYYFTGTGAGSGSRGLEIDTEAVGAQDEGVILNARASGTTGRIKFQTNSATAMTILGNGGNIGIGTDNPAKTLDVYGSFQVKDSGGATRLLVHEDSGQFEVNQSVPTWTNTTHDPSPLIKWGWKSSCGNYMFMASGGNAAVGSQMSHTISENHGFKVGRSGYDGTDGDISSAAEYFRITNAGKVGINTSIPTAQLSFLAKRATQTYPPICFQSSYASDLADAAISTTDDTGGTDIMIGSNVYMGQNGAFVRYKAGYGSAAVRCQYTGKTLFYNKSGNNAPEESMRIDGAGLVGIGTNSNWSPYKLQVAGGLGIAESANTGQQAMSITNNSIQTLAIGVAYNALLLNKDGGNVGINDASPNGKLTVKQSGLADNLYKFSCSYRSGGNASGYTASGINIDGSADNSNGEKHTSYINFSSRDPALNGNHGASAWITMSNPDSQSTYGTGQLDFYIRHGAAYSFKNDPQAPSSYWMSPLFTIKSSGKIEMGSGGTYGSSPKTLNIGSRANNVAGSLAIARGEAIGGGTGPLMEFIHGPDGGTQRQHTLYSYVGDFRIFADPNENMELRGANIIMKNGNDAVRATLQSGGNMTLADGGFVSYIKSDVNVSVDTHTWTTSQWNTVVGTNVFDDADSIYLVNFKWNHEGHGSPYLIRGNFLWSATNANHTGEVGQSFTPVQAAHTSAGTSMYFQFQGISAGQTRAGLRARAMGFNPNNNNSNGYLEVRATKIADF